MQHSAAPEGRADFLLAGENVGKVLAYVRLAVYVKSKMRSEVGLIQPGGKTSLLLY